MAEFNGSLFNDGPFDGDYVFGSGAALGATTIACGGTVIKIGRGAAVASAHVGLLAGLLTTSTVGALGCASATCEPARVRESAGAVVAGAVTTCDSLRYRTSEALVEGSGQGACHCRRLRSSPVQMSGIAVLAGAIDKLAFPSLAQGLRVRRWSKPAGVVGLVGK